MFFVFLNVNSVNELKNFELGRVFEITSSEFFQFIRRICPIHEENAISLSKLTTKIKRKFQLTESETKKLIRQYVDQGILVIGYNDSVNVDVLANNTRKKIYTLIQQYPGLYSFKIQSFLELGANQTLWHLSFLVELEYIQKFKFGKVYIFADYTCPYEKTVLGFILLKDGLHQIIKILIKLENGAKIDVFEEKLDYSKSNLYVLLRKLTSLKIVKKSLTVRGYYLINSDKKQSIKELIQKKESFHRFLKNLR